MDKNTRELALAGIVRVSARVPNLVLLMGGFVAAAALRSWVLALAAALVYTVALGLQLRSVNLWKDLLREARRRPLALPEESELVDDTAKHCVARLLAARAERDRALACAPGAPSDAVYALIETACELEGVVIEHLRSLDRLGRYLRFVATSEVRLVPTPVPGDREWLDRIGGLETQNAAELAALQASLRQRVDEATEILVSLPNRLTLLCMGQRPDVVRAQDREVRERLLAELTQSGP